MSENWKPGDVAMAVKNGAEEHRAFFTEDLGWVCLNGIECHPDSVRRLVVIDPDNAHEVGALADLFFQGKNCSLDAQMAALREFANPTPPKPEEPTGLGAVVEDVDGGRWLAIGVVADGPNRWARDGAVTGSWRRYAEISAVRVLSEGVTND